MRPSRTVVSRCLLASLAALAIASWVTTFVVFRGAKRFYAEIAATRLDPLGLRQVEIPAMQGRPTLVFYGDSRAAQWPVPKGFEGRTLNLGISAQTTEQVLLRFNDHLGRLEPKIVVIQVGINDLKAIPLFPRAEGRIVETCKRNIEKIADLCRERGAHVVVTTLFPLGKIPLARRLVWSDRVAPAMDEVNRHIRSLASADVTVFDAAGVLTGEEGNLVAAYSRDFLHLTDAGYARLNEKLREQIEPLLKPSSQRERGEVRQ